MNFFAQTFKVYFLLILPLTLGFSQDVFASSAIKAQRIYYFAQYVRWPSSGNTLVFCTSGNNSIGNSLKKIIKDKKIQGKALTYKKVSNRAQAKSCHVLFVSSAKASIAKNLSRVLTVSDKKNFAKNIGIIEFINSKGQFNINNRRAKQMGISIRSKLLQRAEHVYK